METKSPCRAVQHRGMTSGKGAHHAEVQAYSPLRFQPRVCKSTHFSPLVFQLANASINTVNIVPFRGMSVK